MIDIYDYNKKDNKVQYATSECTCGYRPAHQGGSHGGGLSSPHSIGVCISHQRASAVAAPGYWRRTGRSLNPESPSKVA